MEGFSEVQPVTDKVTNERLLKTATKIKEDFINWSNKNIFNGISVHNYGEEKQELTVGYLTDQIKNSPSKDFLKKTLEVVGLYDIGLTVAAVQMGVPKELIPAIWITTFLAPVVEEFSYRNGLIPQITTEIAHRMGFDMRSDNTRMLMNGIFAAGHLNHARLDMLFTGAYLTKVANEKGLSAAVAVHSIINASILGIGFLTEVVNKLPPQQAETAKTALLTTMWTGLTALGIEGAKEIWEDRQIHNTIQKLRSVDRIDNTLKTHEIKDMYEKLLKYPSSKGYKFKAGVELAYITGMLESFEFMHQPEMRDKYALEQVRKAVEKSCPDREKLNERLAVAFDYIDRGLKTSKPM